ncbi:MAG: FAD-dependent oxidoreductase, partial [Solirubrobacterales bacterium]
MDLAGNDISSPWLAGSELDPRPPLSEEIEADALVVGGGIVGVAAAQALAEAGLTVALLEARTISSGVTGNSTAKLSALQGLIYREIRSAHGDDASRAYAELSRSGLEQVVAIAERHGIECSLERRPALTYSEDPDRRDEVEEEVEAAIAAGLEASFVEQTDLPFAVAAAVRVPQQAQFDPVAWTRGLAEAIAETGVRIYENTRATKVRGANGGVRVETEHGATIRCDHLVVATHMPFLDRGLYFARLRAERSYAVAGPVAADAPQGMYLSVEKPARSIRSFADRDGSTQVIVGGEGHKAGQSDPAERYRRLESDLGDRFGAERVSYRWASHDLISADKLPFVGRLTPLDDRILTATGFNKWGLAAGVGAAAILTDLVLGRESALGERFDPARLNLRVALPSIAKEGADFSARFAVDRLRRRGSDDLAPGEGRVASAGTEQHAVFRDEAGAVHRLSARCTHLGC